MPGIGEFLKALLIGKMGGTQPMGQQMPPPYMTPGFNPNLPHPMQNQVPTMPNMPQGVPQMPGQGPLQQQRMGGLLQNPQAMSSIAQILMAVAGGRNGGYMAQGAQGMQQQQLENQQRQQQIQQQGEYQQGSLANDQARIQADVDYRNEMQAQREAMAKAAQQQREITDYNTAQDNLRQAIISSGTTDPAEKLALAESVAEGLPQLYRDKLRKFAETFMPPAEKAPGSAGEYLYLKKNKMIPETMSYEQWKASDRTQTEGELTYQDWLKKPENKGKGRDDFLVWKGKNSPSVLMQSGPPPMLKAGTQEEMLASVPEALRARVKAILEYRVAPPSGYVLSRDPGWKQAKDYALQIDPTYDEKSFPTRSKMLADYTSAKGSSAGAQINAINTVLGHTAVLGESIDALENGDILKLNQIANYLKVQTGDTPVTTLKAIVNRVGPEVTRAYVGTGGEFAERKENEADFSPNYSPAQLKNNVAITIRLLRSKMGSLENQWFKTMGKDDFRDRFITPEAEAAIEKWGGQGANKPVNPYRK